MYMYFLLTDIEVNVMFWSFFLLSCALFRWLFLKATIHCQFFLDVKKMSLSVDVFQHGPDDVLVQEVHRMLFCVGDFLLIVLLTC